MEYLALSEHSNPPKAFDKKATCSIQLREFRISGTKGILLVLCPCSCFCFNDLISESAVSMYNGLYTQSSCCLKRIQSRIRRTWLTGPSARGCFVSGRPMRLISPQPITSSTLDRSPMPSLTTRKACNLMINTALFLAEISLQTSNYLHGLPPALASPPSEYLNIVPLICESTMTHDYLKCAINSTALLRPRNQNY